ncbi:MAG: exo-alpha-sialidase [Candidatus Hydrogenedentes bacterium]|nr:exo-alpha-sialidase [Candidatus Hydrogenedentota bacterium]
MKTCGHFARMGAGLFIALGLCPALCAEEAQPAPAVPLADYLLNIEEAEPPRLKEGVLEIAPVVLPEGEFWLGPNDHFGWPVATRADDAIVVLYHRIPQHWGGSAARDEHSSSVVVVRSTDGGATWTTPVDLRSVVKHRTEGCRTGFGNAIGTTQSGLIVAVTHQGVFHSDNAGESWRHVPGAFGGEQLEGPVTNNGPRLIEHPEYGLVVLGHQSAGRNEDGTERIADTIWVRYSKDEGRTWHETKQDLPEWAKPVEPTPLLVGGAFVVVARCHGGFEPLRKTWRYLQLVSTTGWLPFEPALTNMRTSETGKSPWHGPWSQDTVDLLLNPRTGRIEAVATNRDGGGQGREHIQSHMTLNLWSIDRDELLAGASTWRFEGTLLMRRGTHVTNVDGMHPGAGVVDEERGVEHIFVYLGYPAGPAGIFRITRTLDTPALSRWLKGD